MPRKRLTPTASYSPILRECADIADEREQQYGDVVQLFEDIAALCSAAFGLKLSTADIAKIMVAVKLSRERHQHKADNLLDSINYLAILAKLTQ